MDPFAAHPRARVLLIFDGRCGVCTRTAEWVRARDRARRVLALPNQTPGLSAALGLTRSQVDREVWLIERGGRRYAGARAVNRVLRELPAPWPLVATVLALPGIAWAEDRGYRWFARNRGRFARWGVLPACDQPDTPCGHA